MVDDAGGIRTAGLTVVRQTLALALLRHFDSAGPFAKAVARTVGCALPDPLRCDVTSAIETDSIVLAWRSPTETLMLCADAAAIAALDAATAQCTDGCVVEQSGGWWVWKITGERTLDLLTRLGSPDAVPGVGAALTSRIAELTVTALCVRPAEILLLVDRAYSPHLLAWIRATLADFV